VSFFPSDNVSFVQEATVLNGTTLYVLVYNPIAQNRSSIVRLPVASDALYRIERIEGGRNILFLRPNSKDSWHSSGVGVKYELMFDTETLPPLGAVAFRIIKEPEPISSELYNRIDMPMPRVTSTVRTRQLRQGSKEVVELNNGIISVSFDSSTGMLVGLTSDGVVLEVNQTWGYYTSFDSTLDAAGDTQNSGAYIFRPSIPDQKLIPLTPKANSASFFPTAVGLDVHAFFDVPWIKQVTRVANDAPYIEVEFTVGPIPINDRRGKEIVMRLSTPINSNGEFFTDSNGREFQKRKRNFRPTWDLEVFEPVAGNFYPVNAAIFIEDSVAALAIMVDRSQGGASLIDGSIELMVQRRTLVDDSRGVDEPLNETCGGMTPYPPYGFNERVGDGVVISGKHRIRIGKGPVGASLARSEMDDLFAEPILFVGSGASADPVVFRTPEFSGLTADLPPNIMLVTFMRLPVNLGNVFLIRLGHQYGSNEDSVMSQSIDIDISNLFYGYFVSCVVEMTLTGNQEWKDVTTRRVNWNGMIETKSHSGPINSTIYTIAPMEIRTFKIFMSPSI
jgi:alpha-mannosidase